MAQRGSIQSRCRRWLLALLTGFAASAALGATGYSFDAPGQYLTRAIDYPRWAALWSRHLDQTPAIDACLGDATACSDRLKGYREIVLGSRKLSAERKMILVNRFINGRHWRIESGAHDDWRTLTDFLSFGGDCEDYAIAKYFALRQVGFAADDVRVAIAKDWETRAYHAVTVVRVDGQIYFLDVDGAPRHNPSGYRFLFSINENSVWDHVIPQVKAEENRS